MSRISPLLAAALLAAAGAHARCPAGLDAFAGPGRFGVGVRTLPLVDTSRSTPAHGTHPALPSRTLTTEVWYPTPSTGAAAPLRNANRAAGRFPLVVSAHGLLDNRLGESYWAIALASRGFVVAAPDFPLTNTTTPPPVHLADIVNQPGDVSFVVDQLLALAQTRGSWLAGGVDPRRIGVTGLSYGGYTTVLVAYHPTLRDRRIRAALPVAPVGCYESAQFYDYARPPLLVLQGDQDLLLPFATNGVRVFERSRSPRELVELVDGTHTAFSGFVTAPSATSYDAIGCAAVESALASADATGAVAPLLSPPAGLLDTNGCALPCTGPVPANAPMAASRQHQLATAVVAAFFQAAFQHDAAARCFLRRGLAADAADVKVTHATARPLPRGHRKR